MNRYLIALCLFLLSCSPTKQLDKAYKKLTSDTADYKRMAVPADRCAVWYPPVTTTKEVIRYTKGRIDTVQGSDIYYYVDCDSAIQATLDEASRKHIAVKGATVYITRTDTMTDTVTILRENTARIVAQGYQIQQITKDSTKYQGNADYWRKRCLITWGILAVLIIIRFAYRTILKWFV